MATSATEANRSIDSGFDSSRDITADRFRRALSEELLVVFDVPLLARVRHGDETYTVDLISASCQCGDYTHRGHSVVCKHALRAALAAFYTDVRVTEFLAHVAQHARSAGCPNDVHGCRGPTLPAEWDGYLPCAECIEAVRAPGIDEFTVWSRFATPASEQDDDRERVVADGGHETTTDFRGNERRATCRKCGERLLQGSIDIGEEVCIPCSANGGERR